VDPFDGGPHLMAPTEEVTLIQKSRRVRFAGPLEGASQPPGAPGAAPAAEPCAVILRYLPSAPFARSVQSEFRWSGSDGVRLPEAIRGHLGLDLGTELMVTPLPAASQREARPGAKA
jgi:hypothetical protein